MIERLPPVSPGLREERQTQPEAAAARIGCPPRWISRYERGPQVPRTPEIYLRLSVALSVSLAELLGAPPTPDRPADPRLAPAQMPALLAILDAALALADADLPPEDRQAAYDALRKRLEQPLTAHTKTGGPYGPPDAYGGDRANSYLAAVGGTTGMGLRGCDRRPGVPVGPAGDCSCACGWRPA